MARTSRLLTLLQLLRGKKYPVTASDLADELNISERTLYRDIAELIAQGAPISGAAGLGYVLQPGLFLPPLMFTEDETEAVLLGLRYVDQRGDEVLSKAAGQALTKIAAVLSPAAREVMENPVALPGPAVSGFPRNIMSLPDFRVVIRTQAKLRIAYEDAQGTRSERVIWPIALGFMNEARVLVAWCEARQDYRTFRTDRISAVERANERYPGRRAALLKIWRTQMKAGEDEKFSPDRN